MCVYKIICLYVCMYIDRSMKEGSHVQIIKFSTPNEFMELANINYYSPSTLLKS